MQLGSGRQAVLMSKALLWLFEVYIIDIWLDIERCTYERCDALTPSMQRPTQRRRR